MKRQGRHSIAARLVGEQLCVPGLELDHPARALIARCTELVRPF
jgi:hypothetical protein